jgi:site-specific recombinase XerD
LGASPGVPATFTNPPTTRAALALAKSRAYQDAADAPATLRTYAADLANFEAWCGKHGLQPMPATPKIVGAYMAGLMRV